MLRSSGSQSAPIASAQDAVLACDRRATVPEHIGHQLDVPSPVQQVGCETVPSGIENQVLGQLRFFPRFPEGHLDGSEDAQVYVPLESAMHRLMNVDYYGAIVVQARSWRAMDEAAAEITEILELRHRFVSVTGPDFEVQNQKALLITQLAAFRRLTFFLQWIAASTLTVASLGIFGVAWIGVGERVREIGTQRAIGAAMEDMLMQFFIEGFAGPMLGCAVGVAAAWLALRAIRCTGGAAVFLFSADGDGSDYGFTAAVCGVNASVLSAGDSRGAECGAASGMSVDPEPNRTSPTSSTSDGCSRDSVSPRAKLLEWAALFAFCYVVQRFNCTPAGCLIRQPIRRASAPGHP